MAALQCEICGGRLMGRPGGIFECDSCGMEYDTAWAKQKIQEIKGTVKVEGTVQVEGTVTLAGTANKNSLLKRAWLEYESGNLEDAAEAFEKVLDIDPECGDAYWGQLLIEFELDSEDDLLMYTLEDLRLSSSYKMVMRFGGSKPKALLSRWEVNYQNHLAREAAMALEKQQEEEARRQAEEQARQERFAQLIPQLAAVRNAVLPAKQALRANDQGAFFLMPNGMLRVVYEEVSANHTYMDAVKGWKNIRRFELVQRSVLIQDVAGNAYIMQYNDSPGKYSMVNVEFKQRMLVSDQSVVDICCDDDRAYILRNNGVLESWLVKRSSSYQYATDYITEDQKYTQIARICASCDGVFAIRADGVRQKMNAQKQWETMPEDTECVFGHDRLYRYGLVEPIRTFTGKQEEGMTEADGWTEVIDFQHSHGRYAALRMDGTVKLAGTMKNKALQAVSGWENVAAIFVGRGVYDRLYAITKDGRVLTTDRDSKPRKPLFENLIALKQAQDAYFQEGWAKLTAQIQWKNQRKNELLRAQAAVNAELSNLNGIFSGKRRKELEAQLAQINQQLRTLN